MPIAKDVVHIVFERSQILKVDRFSSDEYDISADEPATLIFMKDGSLIVLFVGSFHFTF